jgi:hypothetical protein
MSRAFAIIRDALVANSRPEVRVKSWRDSLRQRLGANGEKLHEILVDLAEGRAWMAELPGGLCSAPVLPSSDIRLRAAMFLQETLYGKAVAQTEIQRAELEAKEFESVRALTDDELELEAARILEARKVDKLSAHPELAEFAEIITEPKELQPDELAATIWQSTLTEEQSE